VTLELLAPAKLNFVLEALGRRPDGYHDIASVMQTIDLADSVRLQQAPTIEIEVVGEALRGVPREGPRNLAFSAAHALAEAAGDTSLGVLIELDKQIPAGMGLGGGSTDAAAVLRGLNQLWQLDFSIERLIEVAAGVGSDVPFFLVGGTAEVSGRGERVEALPDGEALDITLFVSQIDIEDKTRRMYSKISPADFTDGRRTKVAAETLRRGLRLAEADMFNVFDRHLAQVAEPAAQAMALCKDAGLGVFAAGSGPAFFTPAPLAELPGLLLRELARDWGVKAIACRTLERAASTAVREA
jgi:4-diphosphocytidyl-2-C-methyl-D-erythritol kinase